METLSEAIDRLRSAGYRDSFRPETHGLRALAAVMSQGRWANLPSAGRTPWESRWEASARRRSFAKASGPV